MSRKIDVLQSEVLKLRSDSLHADRTLYALEEEVQHLWAASRKNNFDIHVLASKAQDAEDRLETVSSRVEKMSDIVTEQWMEIQRLEQALHITQTRALRARRQISYSRCSFLKFINQLSGDHLQKVHGILDPYIFWKGSTFNSYFSQGLHQLKKVFDVTKKYHHKLQRFIKKEMEKNEFTASLANSFCFNYLSNNQWLDVPLITITLVGTFPSFE
nr:uncharacterized protein LOC107425100 isoform X4 [Ziziphus jujuba var. spinosa]